MLKLIIADDDKLIRSRLIQKIDWDSMGYEVIEEAEDGEELLEKTVRLKPDVVITDIKMPCLDGIEYVRKIKEKNLKVEIVVISAYAEFEYAQKLLQLGAYSYILKPIEKEELKKCMCRLEEKIQGVRSREKWEPVSEKFKMTMRNLCQSYQTEQLLDHMKTLHESMLEHQIEIDKMQQNYMYIFNDLYRNLKEEIRTDAVLKRMMMTLFDDFIELRDEDEIFQCVQKLIKEMVSRVKRLEREEENIYLRKTLDYIDNHFAENLSMAEVANRIGVSYGYMSSILNKSIEGGFVHALRKRRIEESKKLLMATELKMYDIAEKVGFTNPRYFSSIFLAEEGMTPGEYRKKNYDENETHE